MHIIGIDPGTTAVGYAVIEHQSTTPILHDAGMFTVRAQYTPERLKELHVSVRQLLSLWRPTAVSVEKLFFARNTKTALAVAEARGVILLTTALAGITLYEYTPLQIKKTITGDGRADKSQIKKMLQIILKGAPNTNTRDDVFDAIAIALTCHYINFRYHVDKLKF